jgi:hypothetical protein
MKRFEKLSKENGAIFQKVYNEVKDNQKEKISIKKHLDL